MQKFVAGATLLLATICCVAGEHPHDPEIQQWERLAHTATDLPEVDVQGTRLIAGLFIAMYFSGAAVDERYELDTGLPDADASPDEAAVAAGAAYLSTYLNLDTSGLYGAESSGEQKDLRPLAEAAATIAFDLVTKTEGERASYRPFSTPGRYVPTTIPGDVRTSNLPHFAFDPALATKITPPPAVDSDAFVESYIETRRLGAADSTERTEDETKASMIFDLQDPHPMIYRLMAKRDLSLFEQARIMAIYNMGAEDSTAAQFAGKLHFQAWRPITAIRNGDVDGREETVIQPDWTPLLETPNSSEYPCGHCTFVSATAHMLDALLPLEPGERIVILASDIYTKTENRGFDGDLAAFIDGFRIELHSYAEYSTAGSMSRIHNGAHFRYSIEAGQALGKSLAETTLAKWDGLPD